MSRTRTRGALSSGTYGSLSAFVNNASGNTISVGGRSIPPYAFEYFTWDQNHVGVDGRDYGGKLETITDNPSGVGVYNEVDQVKEEADYPLQVVEFTRDLKTPDGDDYNVTFWGNVASSYCQKAVPTGGPYPPQDGATVLKARATNTMKPSEPPMGADIANFIGELTDFDQLLKNLGRNLLATPGRVLALLAARKNPKRWKFKLNKTILDLTVADLVKLGVSADLARKLVWEPLIKDIQKIKRAIYDYDRAYARCLSMDPFRVRGRASSESNCQVVYGSSSAGNIIYSDRQRRIEVVTWAQCAYEFPAMPDTSFFTHYYGLWARPSLLWEWTSLSFIFDWFVDVGRWLRQFERSPYQLPFRVVQSGYSVKETVTHTDELRWNLHSSLTGGATLPPVQGKYSTVSYKRFRAPLEFNNADIEPLQIRLPSLGQIGTLAELILLSLKRGV
jgi:hypothetical protein